LRIPLAEYTAQIAPTEYAQGLLDHLKTDPQGMSRAEAQVFMQSQSEELQAEVQRVLTEKAGDDAFKASAEAVKASFTQQLNTAGRFTPEVNATYATMLGNFYAVTAAKAGMTPEQLLQRYPLRVQAEGVQGAATQYDQTGNLKTDTPEFKTWFSESKVKDADGKPLVVYHGGAADMTGDFAFDPAKMGSNGSAEGYGFYFTSDESTAKGYKPAQSGSVAKVYLSLKKPMPVGQKPFSIAELKKIIKDMVESETREYPDEIADYKDGFLSNYVDTYSKSLDAAIGEVAKIIKDGNDKAVDQIAELSNAAGSKTRAFEAVRNATGYDGIVADGYGGRGEAGGTIFVAWFPTQIKSVDNRGAFDANDPNIYNQFAGPNAKTADIYSKITAEERLAKGEPAERVRRETGWFQGVDGMWRFEIADNEAKFNDKGVVKPEDIIEDVRENSTLVLEPVSEFVRSRIPNATPNYKATYTKGEYAGFSAYGKTEEDALNNLAFHRAKRLSEGAFQIGKAKVGDTVRLAEALDHPKLYAAYPDLAGLNVTFVDGVDFRGAYYPQADRIEIAISGDQEQMLSTLLHEIQHAIQQREGFATGGAPVGDFTKAVKDALSQLVDVEQTVVAGWKWNNKDKLDAAEQAAQVARYGLMWESAQRLIDYSNRDKPSGVFRLIRNELQWIYSDDMRKVDEAQDLQLSFYGIPKSGPKRNQVIGDMAFRGARMLLDTIPKDLQDQFKADPRTMKGMLAALERESNKARKALAPLRKLERKARNAKNVMEAHRYSTPFEVYQALAGEIEARNTQARQQMTEAERQASSPAATADVPAERTVVMFGGLDIQAPMAAFSQDPAVMQQGSGNRGQIAFGQDITQVPSIITLLKGADLSTFLHESGHFFLEVQFDLASRIMGEAQMFGTETNSPGESEIVADTQTLLKYFGVTDLAEWYGMPLEQKRSYHEQFARGFEAYLFEGKAPSIEMQGIFQRFRAWMLNVYREIKALNVEITDEVRGVMDRMLATTEQIQLAEAGRSMMPLFTSPEQAGMTTEEFAAYQALGVDATQDAIQDLQARTLRDMAWIKNAKGREIKRLQKQAEGRRAEMTIEARREIMSQPVYRAWQFLTAKPLAGAGSRERTIGGAPAETGPAPVLIGIDGIPLAEGGAIFKSANAAKEAKKLQANTRVVKVEGGFALAEKSEAQLAAEAAAAKRLAVHEFIASRGGLAKTEMADTGFDANVRVGSRWLFAGTGKGMSIGEVAELLQQYGYMETEDQNAAYELVKRSVTDPQYTPEGWERIAEIETEANTADEMPGLGTDFETTTTGKFDLTALKSIDLPAEIVQIMVDLNMTATDGIHPDIVADNFEFGSGNELVRTLAIAETPADAIEALTDQKMLENYGELATPEAIERAADVAIHNDARARFVAAELNAVNKAAGRPKVLASAAREFAAKMIDRLQIRNIKPHQYAAAEARATKASTQAMKAGDTATAATEKRNQLINAYATKAAYDAQAEVERVRKFFATVTKGGNKKLVERGRDPDVVNAARAILAAYGVAPRLEKDAQDYMALLQRNDPAMYEVLRPSIEAALANAKPLDQLTMEELRGLNDEVAAMWHLSKRSRQMEIDGNLLDMDDVAAELTDRITEIGIPDTIPGEGGAITKAEAARQSLQYAGALLRRVEQWAEAKDARFGGPFLRYVFQPVKAAADRYRADRAEYRKAFLKLVEGVAPSMKQGVIAAPEIGYTFGRGHNGVGMAEMLHAVLHTGNDSNKRKLLLGRGWATENEDGTLDTGRWDAFVDRMIAEGKLTRAHYDFAQGVWDLLEQMKPLAQKTHRDVFGRYFDEVTANAFETPFGTYRGGYVPAQADPRIVTDAAIRKLSEQENENMAYSFPGTAKGFTKGRVEYNRPLILDLRTLTQHMDKVLLFSHMEPAVRDVNKLLMRKGVSYGLTRIDPAAYEGMLIPWLNRAARQQVETPIVGDGRITRVLSVMRNRAGMALMFGNISNTLQQVTGFASALTKVKHSHLRRAVADYIKNPKKTTDAVAEASIFMRDRMDNEVAAINNQMDEILLDPTLYERAQAWTQKHAYFLQAAIDNVMSPMIWTGAYNQAITEGFNDADSVKFADGVVRQTQGATLPEDVSRIETGPAYARIFTQFIGYFNMMVNTNATELQKISDDVGMKKGAGRALGIVFYGLLAPAWVSEAIAIAMRGGPEDEDDDGYLDDWLASVIGMGTLKTLLAGVPFVGQFINAGINRFNGNPMDDRVSLSPAVSLLESTVGAPQSVYKALVEDGSKARAVKDVATAVSIVTGLPAYAVVRPLSYLTGIADDRIEPTGPLDVVRGLATGVASPESRQR